MAQAKGRIRIGIGIGVPGQRQYIDIDVTVKCTSTVPGASYEACAAVEYDLRMAALAAVHRYATDHGEVVS